MLTHSRVHGDGNSEAFDFHLVRAHSRWEQLVRDSLLYCAAKDQFGTNKPTRAQKNTSLRTYLSLCRRGAREPNWVIPSEVISFSNKMKLSDGNIIAALFGSTPWILNDFRNLRNYLAHYSEESALRLRPLVSPSQVELRSFGEDVVDANMMKLRITLWTDEMIAIAAQMP